MPLTQNVSGTLKKITKLTQNVSGVLKPNNSFKMNVNGVLKELLDTLPTSLTWNVGESVIAAYTATISSVSDDGLTVSTRIYSGYTGMYSTNWDKIPRVYTSPFYLEAGKKIVVTGTIKAEATVNAMQMLVGFYNVDTGDFFSTNAGGYDLGDEYVIDTSGNYQIIISGFGSYNTGSASGVISNYQYVNVTANVTFS
jgi:GTPase